MADIARLAVSLTARTDRFVAEIDSAQRRFERMGAAITSAGRTMSTRVTAPIAAVGAAALTAAVRVGNFSDEILDLEQQTGLTTDEIQRFRAVTIQAGVGSDTVAQAVSMLTRRLATGEEGSADLRRGMEQLGVSFRDATGQTRPMGEVVSELLGRLGDMEDVTSRNVTATSIFGRAAEGLAPILALSGEEMERAMDRADDLGLILSRDALEGANAFRVEWDFMKASLAAVVRDVGMSVIPMMQDMVGVFQDNVVPMIQRVISWWENLDPAMQRNIAIVAAVVAAIGPLLVILGVLVSSIGTLIGAAGTLVGMFGTVAGAAPLVVGAVAAINAPVLLIVGALASLVAAGVAVVRHWDVLTFEAGRVVGFLQDRFMAPIMEIADPIVSSVRGLVSSVGTLLSEMVQLWAAVARAVQDIIIGLVGLMREYLVDRARRIFRRIQPLLSTVLGWWQTLGSAVARTVTSLMQVIQEQIVDRFRSVIELVSRAIDWLSGLFRSLRERVSGPGGDVPVLVDEVTLQFDAMESSASGSAQSMADDVGEVFGGLPDRVIPPTTAATSGAADAFDDLTDRVNTSLAGMTDGIDTSTRELPAVLNEPVTAATSQAAEDVEEMDQSIRAVVGELWGSGGVIDSAFRDAERFISDPIANARLLVERDWGALLDTIINSLPKLRDAMGTIFGAITDFIGGVRDAINLFSDAFGQGGTFGGDFFGQQGVRVSFEIPAFEMKLVLIERAVWTTGREIVDAVSLQGARIASEIRQLGALFSDDEPRSDAAGLARIDGHLSQIAANTSLGTQPPPSVIVVQDRAELRRLLGGQLPTALTRRVDETLGEAEIDELRDIGSPRM